MSRQCTATAKATGERCRATAIRGGNVCIKHGGAAGQVRAAARRRLDEMVDPALGALMRAMQSRDMRAVVQSAKAVLDRAGYPAARKLEIDDADRQITEHQAEQIVRIIYRVLGAVGVPPEDPAIRKIARAAIMAETNGDEWHRPEGVGVVSEDTAKVMLAELRQEPPPLMLVAAPESEDADPDDAEEVAL